MIKVSELLSKQLICLETATVAGTIGNIIFDERLSKGKLLELFCEDDETPETKFVELKNVSAFGEDACVVKNSDNILYEWIVEGGVPSPMNCLCYNQDGKDLGKVRDIELEGQTVTRILLEKGEFTAKELLSYSNKLLIFNDTGKPIKLKPKNKTFNIPAAENTSVQLHSVIETLPVTHGNDLKISASEESNLKLLPELVTEKIDVPTKITQSSTIVSRSPARSEVGYKFLLGKPVHSSILGSDGKILIPESTIVSEDIIKLARNHGKLVQLALRAY